MKLNRNKPKSSNLKLAQYLRKCKIQTMITSMVVILAEERLRNNLSSTPLKMMIFGMEMKVKEMYH